MPELPEVETTKLGLLPHLKSKTITDVIVRAPKLRWPIPTILKKNLVTHQLIDIERRAKYLLFKFEHGCMIVHLGMSGRLQVISEYATHQKHDHVDIIFEDNICLRYTDPRRFGCILWTTEDPISHKLLKNLGPEPFDKKLNENHLFNLALKKTIPVKTFIMDPKIIVGVGNIYASESLYAANINPLTPAQKITREKYKELLKHIRRILKLSIQQGGTTLKDFLDSSGKPGYFAQKLKVYGREKMPCFTCKEPIQSVTLAQRNTFFCANCQI